MEIRSFLAFELPPGIKSEVARISGEVKKSGLNAGWVKPGNIHLTVVFMGNINSDDVPVITSLIGNAVSSCKTFDISLGGMGLFPDIRRPRVIWLGLNGEIDRLSSLRDDLQKPLESFGIKQEKRPFKAHLTLGRFRKPVKDRDLLKRIVDEYKHNTGPEGSFKELVMFKSELKPGGAVYTRLHSWPLIEK